MANESEPWTLYDFFYKPIPRDPDPSIFLTLHPECNFTSQAPDLPAAAFPIAWFMAIFSLIYFLIPLPIFFARRNIFPLTLKSPPLILTVCTGYLMMHIFIYWRDILGNKTYPCLDHAIHRTFFIPLTFIPYIMELSRLRAKIALGEAVEQLEAAPAGVEHDRCLAQVKTAKAQTRWQADIGVLLLAGMPSTLYFFAVIYPDPKVYFGCIGCVPELSDSLMRSALAGVCTMVSFYLLHKLRDYPDELGLKKEVKTSFQFSSFLIIFLQVWKQVGHDTITPFLNSNNLIMIAVFYINYVYIIRPTLMTFPSIQRRIVAKRRRRIAEKKRSKCKHWCSKWCRNTSVSVSVSRKGASPDTTSLMMSDVLDNAECMMLFKAHLATEFNQENILFWEHATKWVKAFDDTSLEENVIESKKIYDKFICNDAVLQVNLDTHQFTALGNVFNSDAKRPLASKRASLKVGVYEQCDIGAQLTKTVFDEAIEEIFWLMKRDSLQRFKSTARYQKAIEAFQNARKATLKTKNSASPRSGWKGLGDRVKGIVAGATDNISALTSSSHAPQSIVSTAVHDKKKVMHISEISGTADIERFETQQ